MSFEDDLTAATQSLDAAAQAYHGKISQIDARVGAARNQIKDMMDAAQAQLTRSVILPYNPETIHSKTSLALANDPGDNTKTVWAPVAPLIGETEEPPDPVLHVAALRLMRAYAAPPGYYQIPQYDTDQSVTSMQFVFAGNTATSQQINEALAASNVTPVSPGHFSTRARSVEVPIIAIGGQLGVLFVRFANKVYPTAPAGSVVQPVATHGGEGAFAIHSVEIFDRQGG